MLLKQLLSATDTFFLGLCGINLMTFFGLDISLTAALAGIDLIPRLIMTVVGIAFLWIRAHHAYWDNKLNREKKRLELEQYKKSLEK